MAPTQEALYADLDLDLSWSEGDLPERERTKHVQGLESGLDAAGADVAAFNCLLMRVKTAHYNEFVLERELRDACRRLDGGSPPDLSAGDEAPAYVRTWYAPEAAAELLFWRSLVDEYENGDVLRVVLAR